MARSGEVTHLECDECGSADRKISRRYKGCKYCTTCYAREFKSSSCPGCGEIKRLPRRDDKALCITCEASKPCIRCGRANRPLAKLHEKGPVCNSCGPYFREIEACEQCGAMSKRLSRVSRLGSKLRLCPTCATSDFASCNDCGRYRLLQSRDDGTSVCKKCFSLGSIECPSCSHPMPAGLGSRCEECYWSELLSKRMEVSTEGLGAAEIRRHWREFASWLKDLKGPRIAAIELNKYLPFFMDIERRWGSVPEYSELLSHYGADGLRKYLRALRWLEESGLVVVDKAAKDKDSELRRIKKLIESLTLPESLSVTLEGFVDHMNGKVAREATSLKSMRLSLTAAVGLLRHILDSDGEIDQIAVDAYINHRPGQRAALSGFVGFLNRKQGFTLKLPPAASLKPSAQARKKMKLKLIELLNSGDEHLEEAERQWQVLAMAYFHWLSERRARQIVGNTTPIVARGGYEFYWENECYWIPNRSFCLDI